MPASGARHKHHRHRDEDDGDLFRHQHPASATAAGRPSRYSSPSRPRRADGEVPASVTTWGVAAAVSGILQSLVWAGLSVAAALLYRDIIPAPEQPAKGGRWDDFGALLANLYFRETGVYPVAEQGLTSPRCVYRFMAATLIASVLWLITSGVMLRQMRLGSLRSVRSSAVAWSVTVVAATVVDVTLAAAMVHDLITLSNWEGAEDAFPGDIATLKLCPGALLVAALRAGVLLVANVVCMVVILYRLGQLRPAAGRRGSASTSSSPSATKREGPIDGFHFADFRGAQTDDFRNSHSLGVQNPVFVPDEAIAPVSPSAVAALKPWVSFKQTPQQTPGHRQGPRPSDNRHKAAGEDFDDVSHLSWMEEPDRHVRARPVAWQPAPAHHRRGFVEVEPNHVGRRGGEATPPPAFRSSTASLQPAGHGGDPRLPRVRINPNAPKFPVIPAPDYSPPVPRATGKAADPFQRQHQHQHQHQHRGLGAPNPRHMLTQAERF